MYRMFEVFCANPNWADLFLNNYRDFLPRSFCQAQISSLAVPGQNFRSPCLSLPCEKNSPNL